MTVLRNFINEVVQELTKVSWPTRNETIKMTAVVIIVTVLIGAYVGSIDYGLTKAIETIIK